MTYTAPLTQPSNNVDSSLNDNSSNYDYDNGSSEQTSSEQTLNNQDSMNTGENSNPSSSDAYAPVNSGSTSNMDSTSNTEELPHNVISPSGEQTDGANVPSTDNTLTDNSDAVADNVIPETIPDNVISTGDSPDSRYFLLLNLVALIHSIHRILDQVTQPTLINQFNQYLKW